MVEQNSIKLLFVVSDFSDFPGLIARMRTPLTVPYDIVTSREAYDALPDKYAYDAIVVHVGAHVPPIINDQALNS